MNTPTWKVILIIALILFVPCGIVGAVFFMRRSKAKKALNNSRTPNLGTTDTPPKGTVYPQVEPDFPLKYNPSKKKALVAQLQNKLNQRIFALLGPVLPYDDDGKPIRQLKEDGYFGSKTLSVVKFVFKGKTEVTKEMFNSL